ncbi:chromate transporter [Streptomyces acidicola]|uniref:chromate transporter n=1 Tax=Streptomyces acidicola TaxID=2596892 RepID=UPI003F4DBEC5
MGGSLAYAVLTYVAQQAVQHYGWLSAGEMVRGLALAETAPDPLIMVARMACPQRSSSTTHGARVLEGVRVAPGIPRQETGRLAVSAGRARLRAVA